MKRSGSLFGQEGPRKKGLGCYQSILRGVWVIWYNAEPCCCPHPKSLIAIKSLLQDWFVLGKCRISRLFTLKVDLLIVDASASNRKELQENSETGGERWISAFFTRSRSIAR